MRVLVTGASGLLGGGLARALAERGDDVTVLQRRAAGLKLREIRGDVADPAPVGTAVAGQDAVIHLAAKVNVVGPWAEYERANILGTTTIVQACRRAGVRRLVHVSSPSVANAGLSLVGVGAEPADPYRARGPYARSKAAAELIALGADSASLRVVAIRPHLVWGPHDTQLTTRVVSRARAGRLPLIGSGSALVDTTYVDNAVEALMAALDRCEHAHGQALVVSNGEPRPIGDILASICAAAGVDPPSRRIPRRLATVAGTVAEAVWPLRNLLEPGSASTDPPLTRFLVEQLSSAHWFDQRHTREVLQWAPRVGIEEGMLKLARWYAAGQPAHPSG